MSNQQDGIEQQLSKLRRQLIESFKQKLKAGDNLDAVVVLKTDNPAQNTQFFYPVFNSKREREKGLENLSEAIKDQNPKGFVFVQNIYYRDEQTEESNLALAFTNAAPGHKSTLVLMYNDETGETLEPITPEAEPEVSSTMLEGLDVFTVIN